MMKHIKIYTDGACSGNPGPGGWATVFFLKNGAKLLKGNETETTNNRMELLAVIKALRKIQELNETKGLDDIMFLIHSDSSYVVNSVNLGWVFKWQMNEWVTTKGDDVKNKDMWEEFVKLKARLEMNGVKFKLVKVKGHAGDSCNEFVDEHARKQSLLAKEIQDANEN